MNFAKFAIGIWVQLDTVMNWLDFKIKRSKVIVTVRLHASFIFLSKPVCSQIEIIQNYNKQAMGKLGRESISGNVLLGNSVEMSAETCMGNVQIRMQAYRFLHLVVTVCDTLAPDFRKILQRTYEKV